MANPIIEIQGLTKRFGSVLAVDSLGFQAGQGETIGLLGGNGAGKTTTLGMLLGLILPSEGTMRIFGHDMIRDRHLALARMNFSSPYVDLPLRLTVRENLTVYGHLYTLSHLKQRIEAVAESLDLTELLNRPTGRLSSGQKTRVALAKALLNEPHLLLLDEPTASMDPDTADVMRRYLEEYQARTGATIILASHNMAEVERLCNDVLVLKSGKLVAHGAPDVLVARYGRDTMEDVFLDIARDRRTPDQVPS